MIKSVFLNKMCVFEYDPCYMKKRLSESAPKRHKRLTSRVETFLALANKIKACLKKPKPKRLSERAEGLTLRCKTMSLSKAEKKLKSVPKMSTPILQVQDV